MTGIEKINYKIDGKTVGHFQVWIVVDAGEKPVFVKIARAPHVGKLVEADPHAQRRAK